MFPISSVLQVYIGIVSSLVVVPVNLIILNIFRNARPKTRKVRRLSKMISLVDMSGISGVYTSNSRKSFETVAQRSGVGPIDVLKGNSLHAYSQLPSVDMKKKRDQRLSRWARFKRFILPSSLPHCFVYLGWLILVVVTSGK